MSNNNTINKKTNIRIPKNPTRPTLRTLQNHGLRPIHTPIPSLYSNTPTTSNNPSNQTLRHLKNLTSPRFPHITYPNPTHLPTINKCSRMCSIIMTPRMSPVDRRRDIQSWAYKISSRMINKTIRKNKDIIKTTIIKTKIIIIKFNTKIIIMKAIIWHNN
jgi:hypothetical protein